MPNCSVMGCRNRSDRKSGVRISFHRYPRDERRRNEWLKAINRINWIPSKYAVICSAHFAQDYFDCTGNEIRLYSHAIPSLSLSTAISEEHNYCMRINIVGTDDALTSPEGVSGPSSVIHTPIREKKQFLSSGDISVSMTTSPTFSTPRKRKLRRQLNSAKKRIKYLQQKNRRLKKSLKTMKELLRHLKQKNLLDLDDTDILSNINGTSKELLFKQVVKAKNRKTEKAYSPALKKFALT